jgi:acetyl-CoA synthetase
MEDNMANTEADKRVEIALRIREMRLIFGYTEAEMAEKTEVGQAEYHLYELGQLDFPFTFLYKCAHIFGIGITDLLEGRSATLSSYTVTHAGEGQETAKEYGIDIQNLAPMFRSKIAEPYWVRYDYVADLQDKPIHLTTHQGQEFDYVLKGCMKIQIGDNIEYLKEGDSIYYNSSTPHGMIAVGGNECLFLAVVLPGEVASEAEIRDTFLPASKTTRKLVSADFIDVKEDEHGYPTKVTFKGVDRFNFAFDVVDMIARRSPDKLAMLHISRDGTERRFTFEDMRLGSNKVANYLKSVGVKKGDRVMLVLKRHYQFWLTILALHKLGAVVIPATNQLLAHDFEYRFNRAEVSAIVCTADGDVAHQVESVESVCPTLKHKILVGGSREGWRNFDEEYPLFDTQFARTEDSACGNDVMLMFFTSGTTGYPKIAQHTYTYPLGHYVTAKYWHGVTDNGLHFTISDTGWGKALWGKLYGQWLAEGAVFVYDFDRFDASVILPMFVKYHITSFCAPPTMLRMMIKEDIGKYDLSSIWHMTTAGEALNPEVYRQFQNLTGLQIHEGFGQTETTLTIANLLGSGHKIGSMGKPTPAYDIVLLDGEGNEITHSGEIGEIAIRVGDQPPCGLFVGYYHDEEKTREVYHDGFYHTGDTAWRDEDGYYWYVGRVDDVIKSSGYRIGPFEIESVIMELPYVLECGVSAAPDEVRGQVVKASIVLTKGTQPSEELKKEIQNYVKSKTAPYKYPRIVVFREELPKTISGKIQRNLL